MGFEDMFNARLSTSIDDVDKINKEFYEMFNYPWPPLLFEEHLDKGLYDLLNQDLGYFRNHRIPRRSRIWVAGCGTNQAIFTSLKFPESTIVGTDISAESLRVCKKNSSHLGIKNMELYEQSILTSDFVEEFDYVICTGVVHHTGNPLLALQKIRNSLKKDGIIELMVYNYFHRVMTTACQKAIACLTSSFEDFSTQLNLIRKLVDNYPFPNVMGDFLTMYKNSYDEEIADALIQPVEFSYSIDTLHTLLSSCNLEYILPCLNQFDKEKSSFTWNMTFNETELDERYNKLPDHVRWQITNLLMLNESPMLWFYVQKSESSFKRKTEKDICEEFLNTKFERFNTVVQNHRRFEGEYRADATPKIFPSPPEPPDELSRTILNNLLHGRTMREVFNCAGIPIDFKTVNHTRISLTTPLCPYLVAIKS